MGKNPAEKAKAAEAKAADKKVESSRKEKTKKKKSAKVIVARADRKCKIAKCKRDYRAKSYCGVHYKQWRQGKFGRARYKICGDVGCTRPMAMNRHGYCEEHYQNYYVKGVEAPAPQAEAPAKPAEKATA